MSRDFTVQSLGFRFCHRCGECTFGYRTDTIVANGVTLVDRRLKNMRCALCTRRKCFICEKRLGQSDPWCWRFIECYPRSVCKDCATSSGWAFRQASPEIEAAQ